MKRRDLFKAAPAAALFALPAMAHRSPLEQIQHHAAELRRLLAETLPGGGEVNRFMIFNNDGSLTTTGPHGFVFHTERGGWHEATH